MAIGLLIVGDEILSGKRADRHLSKVIEILQERGLQLDWANYLGDDPERIVQTLKRTFASDDIVFSCGGIGSTPDDHTRRCAAAALGVPLALHPVARERIMERISKLAQENGTPFDPEAPDNRNRMKMGEFPLGAQVIPNAFNGIPGFSVRTHYFVPGFPEMAWPMIEWALDTHHADRFHQADLSEKSVFIYGIMESTLTPLMERIEVDYPGVKTFSLPKVKSATVRAHIELGVKGPTASTADAFEHMMAWLRERQVELVLTEEDLRA